MPSCAAIMATVRSASAPSRSTTSTRVPARANRMAAARPLPMPSPAAPPPATMATLPARPASSSARVAVVLMVCPHNLQLHILLAPAISRRSSLTCREAHGRVRMPSPARLTSAGMKGFPARPSLLGDVPEGDVGGDQHALDVLAERSRMQILTKDNMRGVFRGAHAHGLGDG